MTYEVDIRRVDELLLSIRTRRRICGQERRSARGNHTHGVFEGTTAENMNRDQSEIRTHTW